VTPNLPPHASRTWVHTPPRPYRRCTLVTLLTVAPLWWAAPWLHVAFPGPWAVLSTAGLVGCLAGIAWLLKPAPASPALPREVPR
jgi:hypothetical protein